MATLEEVQAALADAIKKSQKQNQKQTKNNDKRDA